MSGWRRAAQFERCFRRSSHTLTMLARDRMSSAIRRTSFVCAMLTSAFFPSRAVISRANSFS